MNGFGKRVIVGMSGGVDSSVTAALLKDQGYEVIGMFMKNWDELDENGVCSAAKDYADVVKVCEHLGIDYYSVDFVQEYKDQVFARFLEEYRQGHTPNPDILCNREIKFKVFYEHAMKLGADFLATGHYARNLQLNGRNYLAKGLDAGKDQSYFLYTMKEATLKKVLFPLGELQKSQVRAIAKDLKLSTHDKKDSTGICFIGERKFQAFLSQYLKAQSGYFETLDGQVVGKHLGSCYYTIGQRKGLGLGGPGEPWFVVGKDSIRNVVYVERGIDHPALFSEELTCSELSWVQEQTPVDLNCLEAKIRYRQQDQACEAQKLANGLKVTFKVPQRAITPRQSVVFYRNIEGHSVCLGGGVIDTVGPSLYQRSSLLRSSNLSFLNLSLNS